MQKKQWQIVLVVGLFSSILASVTNFKLANRLNQVGTLEEGSQTCFMRTSQTFTAKLLDEASSDYLKKEFAQGTEDCFSEISTQFNKSYLAYRTDLSIKINSWSSEVHWFYQKLNLKVINNQNSVLMEKFEKLEEYKDAVFDSLEKVKDELQNSINMVNKWLVVSLLLWGVSSIVMLLRFITERRAINRIEEESKLEVSQPKLNHHNVETLIQKIIHALELKNSQLLFEKYKDDFTQKRAMSEVLTRNLTELKPIESVRKEIQEVMPIVGPNLNQTGVNLQSICSKTIDMVSPQIFKHGIMVDLSIPDNTMVEGEKENIEQIIYILLNESIQSFSFLNKSGKIGLRAQNLGGSVVLDYTDTSVAFDSESLKQVNDSDSKILGKNIYICEELIKNINGEILFSNLMNDKNVPIGIHIKMIFRRVENSIPVNIDERSGVVSIVKGKKRDIYPKLKEINM